MLKKYPLQFINTHSKKRNHSQFHYVSWLKEIEPHAVWINSIDAQFRSITDGDMVRVFNDRGEIRIKAKITERIIPGVVNVYQGTWYEPDERGIDQGGCVNVLLNDKASPAGAAAYNTCLVEVQKV